MDFKLEPEVIKTTKPALRDENGLLNGVTYIFNDDQTVNWKAMLFARPEYLYVLDENKKKVEEKYGKPLSEINLAEVEDRFLCITLAGIRYLSNLRGYKAVKQKVYSVTYDPNYQVVVSCTVTCEIEWIGNYETGGESVLSSDVAGANLRNTHSFTKKYIESMAANRAFSRATRSYLNINIVSKEECGPQEFGELLPIKTPANTANSPTEPEAPTNIGHDPKAFLASKVKFDVMKAAILARHRDKIKNSNPEEWISFESIPNNDIYIILNLFKEEEDKKKKSSR